MKKVTKCPECNSNDLVWHCTQKNLSGVVDGRLRIHEVGTEFYLGCERCSETLQVISGDQVAEWLSSSNKEIDDIAKLKSEKEAAEKWADNAAEALDAVKASGIVNQDDVMDMIELGLSGKPQKPTTRLS